LIHLFTLHISERSRNFKRRKTLIHLFTLHISERSRNFKRRKTLIHLFTLHISERSRNFKRRKTYITPTGRYTVVFILLIMSFIGFLIYELLSPY
jgi:hypothetical protein